MEESVIATIEAVITAVGLGFIVGVVAFEVRSWASSAFHL
jgi:hypothetical protein